MLMKKRDVKPTPLALELGISGSTFTDWGRGKGSPSLKAVIQLAEYFDVSLDYLVYGREAKNQNIVRIPNPEDDALLEAFHKLPPELRQKATAYIEGMLSAVQSSDFEHTAASKKETAKLSS